VGDFVFEFGWKLEPAAKHDDRVTVGFRDTQRVLQAADQHRIGLIDVELEIAQKHNVLGICIGEHAIEQLEGVQWVGAGGNATFLDIDQALSGGPGVEAAFERVADGSDFCFGARILG
jgi:hypothetical protein